MVYLRIAALVVLVVLTTAVTWRLVRCHVPWRLLMVVPTVGAFLIGLLGLYLLQHLTWPWAAIWCGVCVAFYADMWLVWWIHGSALRRAGLRW